jgi:gamma-glutamyl phosphate reductase
MTLKLNDSFLKAISESRRSNRASSFNFTHDNGRKNKTAAFGTILIIYESRPDVTVEAGGIAFKSGNKILLKGGKESLLSNLKIVSLWHQALTEKMMLLLGRVFEL